MDLRDRLVELTDEVADVRPPIGLWDREVRRRARARRDTVVVTLVAALAITGLLLGDWHAARQLAPTSPSGRISMPDRFFDPSPWLPGTGAAGELGPLIGVGRAERGSWWHRSPGVVGVSAETGEYRFLDLPDLGSAGVALAPDGRHVAFWTTGAPSDTPPAEGEAITGFALYDTSTGKVREADIPTRHGVDAGELFFVDDATVVATFDQRLAGYDGSEMMQSTSRGAPPLMWRLADEGPAELDIAGLTGATQRPAVRAGRFWSSWWPDHGSVLVDLTGDDPRVRRLRGAPSAEGISGRGAEGALSADGRLLAVALPSGSPNRVGVWDLSPRPGCCGPRRVLAGSDFTFDSVSWLNDDRLLVLQWLSDPALPNGEYRQVLASLDVRTGAREIVARFPADGQFGGEWVWALDLLDAPSAPGQEPPRPWDPRVTTGLVVVVLAGAALVIGVRRRRRGRA